MLKLMGSVGFEGANGQKDVKLVQSLLSQIKVKGKAIFKERIDGRCSEKLVNAIKDFQNDNRLPCTGRICSSDTCFKRLEKALPRTTKIAQGTGTVVKNVTKDPLRDGMAKATEIDRTAPFPDLERKQLGRIFRSFGANLNVCIKRKRDWVTNDGRFATELEIEGKIEGGITEKQEVNRLICSIMSSGNIWEKGNPNNLEFKTKRQVGALKNIPALNKEHLKILNFSQQPKNSVVKSAVVGLTNIMVKFIESDTTTQDKETNALIFDIINRSELGPFSQIQAETQPNSTFPKGDVFDLNADPPRQLEFRNAPEPEIDEDGYITVANVSSFDLTAPTASNKLEFLSIDGRFKIETFALSPFPILKPNGLLKRLFRKKAGLPKGSGGIGIRYEGFITRPIQGSPDFEGFINVKDTFIVDTKSKRKTLFQIWTTATGDLGPRSSIFNLRISVPFR